MLNNKGPRIEPCETPNRIFDQELYVSLICFVDLLICSLFSICQSLVLMILCPNHKHVI